MEVGHIAQLFHQAALAPAQWLPALDALASFTNSYRGQLIGIGGTRSVPFNWATYLDDGVSEEFVEIGGGDPRVNFRVAAGDTSAVGEIIDERGYTRFRAKIGHGIYEEFCGKHDLPLGCQTVLARDSKRVIGLALLRARGDGMSSDADREAFARVMPHVRAAVDLQMAIEHRGAALTQGALDAVESPAILIDAFGRVASMTPTAEEALRHLSHVRVMLGRIRCGSPRDEARVDEALGRVLTGAVPAADLLLRDGADLPLRVSIHRLAAAEWNLGFVPRAVMVLHHRARGQATAALLRSAYGLTGAEVEIVTALRQGISRPEIAVARGAALGTVRQQIKAIFVKLGVNREASLIALLNAIEE